MSFRGTRRAFYRSAPVVGGGAFTPASLGSALKAWYVADTGITLATTKVTTWDDQSGNGFHLTQGTDAQRPTYNATGFNGLPTVEFSGAGGICIQNTSFTGFGAATASVFMVGQMDASTDNFGRAIGFVKSGGAGDENNAGSAAFILRNGTNNEWLMFAEGSARTTAYALSLNTNYRIGIKLTGAATVPYLNNIAGTGAAYSTTIDGAAGGVLSIGSNPAANAEWNGPISEIVITNTALSDSDRNSLDSYFTTKWGL
jgi:hypothetical protein